MDFGAEFQKQRRTDDHWTLRVPFETPLAYEVDFSQRGFRVTRKRAWLVDDDDFGSE